MTIDQQSKRVDMKNALSFFDETVSKINKKCRHSLSFVAMRKEDANLFHIGYRIPSNSSETSIPYVCCSTIDEVKDTLESNKEYRTTLAGRVDEIKELSENISTQYIHRIFTLGTGEQPNIPHIEITQVSTNEQDLFKEMIKLTLSYLSDEQMLQKERGNYHLVQERAMDIARLLDEL